MPGLVYATYLVLPLQGWILRLLGFAARRPNIEALDRDVFSSVSSTFGASYVLLSCGHELTFVENLISAKVAAVISRLAHNQMDKSLQMRPGRKGGTTPLLESLGTRVSAVAKLNRLVGIIRDHTL